MVYNHGNPCYTDRDRGDMMSLKEELLRYLEEHQGGARLGTAARGKAFSVPRGGLEGGEEPRGGRPPHHGGHQPGLPARGGQRRADRAGGAVPSAPRVPGLRRSGGAAGRLDQHAGQKAGGGRGGRADNPAGRRTDGGQGTDGTRVLFPGADGRLHEPSAAARNGQRAAPDHHRRGGSGRLRGDRGADRAGNAGQMGKRRAGRRQEGLRHPHRGGQRL